MIPGAVEANRVMVELGPATTGGPNTSVCVYSVGGDDQRGARRERVVRQRVGARPGTSTRRSHRAASATRDGCDLVVPPEQSAPARRRLVGVAGRGGVPSIASGTVVQAVIANLTAHRPTASARTSWATPRRLTTAPGSSDINLSRRRTSARI